MNFTVVRPVRAAESPASEAGEKLQAIVHEAVPTRPAAMHLPYAEGVIRLDFTSTDFLDTVPDDLS